MTNRILRAVVLALLWLRYRITVRGLREIQRRGTKGIIFLPTHPALMDPIILATLLLKDFQARPFADQDAVDMPGIRWLVKQARAFTIPIIAKYGKSAMARVEATVQMSIEALRAGDNVMLYPSGGLIRGKQEVVGGNSAVETILRALPEVRVVLVRTRGMWGSEFSLIYGKEPDVAGSLLRGIWQILGNFIFFTPRRQVNIEFVEPTDFPRNAERTVMNGYLERFYNENPPNALYVPYTIWERGGRRELPEPDWGGVPGRIEDVPTGTREIVLARLCEMTGVQQIKDTDRLAHDLGMDSLARAELLTWLEGEFGFPQGNSDSVQTVTDALLAACGEALSSARINVKPPSDAWYADEEPNNIVQVAPGATIAECFLANAHREPNRIIVADQTSGAKTYRELVMGLLALLPSVKALPGDCLGLMLPASVAATLTYLTIVFSGRTPVLLNWTVGRRNMLHGLELTGTQKIITAKKLIERLRSQGMDLTGLEERFVYLEDLAVGLSKATKLRALLGSYLTWARLRLAKVSPTAAILFTSGSENLPKAVPISHANILANLRDTLPLQKFTRNDRLLAMLPPFHSFGLTGNIAVALTAGLRTVFYPNPTEGPVLAKFIEAYRASIIIGTPTFINGILRAASHKQLATPRIAVAGAEECPPRTYELLADRCPHAMIIEGYGITECSPIVSCNIPEDARPHAIGRLLPSLEYAILDVETDQPVAAGAPGMLLVRGPSIFAGYLGDAPDPFVEYDGKRWYRTGDLVRRADDGVFTFAGRLKRFIKLGGEMISLPAIESALQEAYGSVEDDGPILAVAATADERPEVVLFTVKAIEREAANIALRDAGLSALHNIRRVERIEAIPVLGTGKTDYRTLQSMVAGKVAVE